VILRVIACVLTVISKVMMIQDALNIRPRLIPKNILMGLFCSLMLLSILPLQAQNTILVDSLLQRLETTKTVNGRADIYAALTWEYRYSDRGKAQEYGDHALALYRSMDDLPGVCKVLNYMGVSKKFEGEFSAALAYYFQVLDLAQRPSCDLEIANAYNNIGEIYRLLGKDAEAIDYADRALAINELIGNDAGTSYNLILKALVLGSQERWDEALMNYQRALSLRLKQGNPERIATMYYYIGNSFMELGEPDSALVYYSKTVNDQDTRNTLNLGPIVYGKYYAAKKEHLRAEQHLLKAIEMLKDSPNDILLEMHELLSSVYYEQADFENAYNQQARANEIRDELLKIDNTRKLTQLEKELEFKVERVRYEANIERQKRLSLSLGLILLMGLTLIWFIARGLKLQKHNNRTLQALNAELERMNATKDKFFSIIAHDLKNPFNSIIGLSSILKDNVHEFSAEKVSECADHIHGSAENTHRLLDNLLSWARVQRGTMAFEPQRVDLLEMCQDVIVFTRDMAVSKQITVMCDLPEKTGVSADQNMLETILRNLLTNAIKFTRPGGKVTVSCRLTGDKVEVSVTDTGVGMDPVAMEKLFQLRTASTPGTNNERGTGLGLMLCKEFMEMHGENIWVESTPGAGSVFRFTLKCAE